MNLEDFNYDLPEDRIAQTPIKKRDNSKLLILNKETGEINHRQFNEIINELNKGDVLVLNNSKVIPARLIGSKEETNAVIELFIIKRFRR